MIPLMANEGGDYKAAESEGTEAIFGIFRPKRKKKRHIW